MRMVVTVAVVSLCGLPSALAQSEDWLILPTTVEEDASWMAPTVREVGRELQRQGVGVWRSERAVAAFEKRGSASPAVISESRIEGWAARAQQALRTLAGGEFATALREFEGAQAFSLNALETLNRDPARAQTVLDTCLYLVRALVATGDEGGATRQVQDCVQIVPSGKPSWQMHPPAVVELFEAAATPAPTHAGTLLVESEPPGCALRVNGVLVGDTPVEVTDLYPGQYRVQVECDSDVPGRVHTVDVPRGATSVFVFDRFDRALRSTPFLHLQYEEPPDARHLARHAREFGRALPAAAVVVASTPNAQDVLELRVLTGTQVKPALARIALPATGPSAKAIIVATAALLAGECKDFTAGEPATIDCRTGEPVVVAPGAKSSAGRPPRGQFVSGVTLASAGTASLLTGYGLLIARRSAGDDWIAQASSLNAQDKWLGIGTGLIVSGSIGGGLLVAAMPLVLPYHRKTPWWAWLSGGLGLVAAAGSIVSGATAAPKPATSCTVSGPDPTLCVNRGRDTDLAILLGATAAPLLTMPLVYLFRRDEKKLEAELSPSIVMSRQGGAVALRGIF